MSLELITIHELLRDPQYREYFKKIPKLPEHIRPEAKPWKLLVLRPHETAWRSQRFHTYRDAYGKLRTLLPDIENAALNCPPLPFMPPIKNVRVKGKFKIVQGGHKKQIIRTLVWRPQLAADMAQHQWCPYCRRPTIFKYAIKSIKSANGNLPSQPALRCIICGASERIVNLQNPVHTQTWDSNRPKVYTLA